jgi:hypothetical protein
MDIGVWMSQGVLVHKRQDEVAVQVWNLRRLPDGLAAAAGGGRLFVSVDGHWRGFFRLSGPVMTNPDDAACPYTLAFSPQSWTAIPPEKSPPQNRQLGYTLDLPALDVAKPAGGTRRQNEIDELTALLEREEERE